VSPLFKKVGAEMVGTFTLVFAGCGAVVTQRLSEGALGHGGVAATFGLAVMVMIYATGHISGAHFNPAVTVAFAAVGRFPWRQVPAYVLGQCAAALLAALCLAALFGNQGLGVTEPSGGVQQSFLLEVIITFFLMFVITAVATDSRAEGALAGLAIGGTVALCALFAGPISGASMNPARSLGPALVQGQLAALWLYLIAPTLGAVVGAVTYRALRCDEPSRAQDADGCC
jgi:aquaporin NIP